MSPCEYYLAVFYAAAASQFVHFDGTPLSGHLSQNASIAFDYVTLTADAERLQIVLSDLDSTAS